MREKKMLIVEIMVGIVLSLVGIIVQIDYYSNMIFAMGFGLSFSAVVQMFRTIYWQKPVHQAEYEQRKREAYINKVDERKQSIRARAGQITSQIMTFFLLFLSFLLALFRAEAWVIGMVYLLFILQWGVGSVVFHFLEKRM